MDPVDRWRLADHAYLRTEPFTEMWLLMTSNTKECKLVEIMLINRFKGKPGCYNEADGGDGIRDDTPGRCFTYCVFADAGAGRGFQDVVKCRLMSTSSSAKMK